MADRTRFLDRYGPWAVVTGASSGIGEEFARQLATRGFQLVVAARREARLARLAEELAEEHGTEVRPCPVDLGAEAGRRALADSTGDLDVGLLISNAGFGLKGTFLELDLARQLAMLEVNCVASVELAHGFGKRLVARGRGGMIFTSSTAAFQGTPFSSAYAATKGFLLQLAEGLWYELRPHGVDVLALCPGPVDTEGPRRTGVDPDKVPVRMMETGPVVRAALKGLGRRPVVIPGAANKLGALAGGLLPRSWATRAAGRMIRRVTGGLTRIEEVEAGP
jgi:short-subunit dehydrogenase